MEKIINLTQHACSNEQASEGVVEPSNKKAVQAALTFVEIPTKETILASATTLAKIASQSGAKKAMIGGAPYLMGALEVTLKKVGIQPVYSFSERVSKEVVLEDGTTQKTSVFCHKGFIEV